MHYFIDINKHPRLYRSFQGLGFGILFCFIFYFMVCLAIDSFFGVDNIGTIYDLFRFACLIIILTSIALFNVIFF